MSSRSQILLNVYLLLTSTLAIKPSTYKYRKIYLPESDFTQTESFSNVVSEFSCSAKVANQEQNEFLLFRYDPQLKKCIMGTAANLLNKNDEAEVGLTKFFIKDDVNKVGLLLGADVNTDLALPWEVLLPNKEICHITDIPQPRHAFHPGFTYFKGRLYDCFGSDEQWDVGIKDCVYLVLGSPLGWQTLPYSNIGSGARLGKLLGMEESNALFMAGADGQGRTHIYKYDLNTLSGWHRISSFNMEYNQFAMVNDGPVLYFIGGDDGVTGHTGKAYKLDTRKPTAEPELIGDLDTFVRKPACVIMEMAPPRGRGILCMSGDNIANVDTETQFMPLRAYEHGTWETLTKSDRRCMICIMLDLGNNVIFGLDTYDDRGFIFEWTEPELKMVRKADGTIDRRYWGFGTEIPSKFVERECWDKMQL